MGWSVASSPFVALIVMFEACMSPLYSAWQSLYLGRSAPVPYGTFVLVIGASREDEGA